jgi:ankyrin repeat protein
VKLLLEAGADINKADNKGKTPLFIAADEGHVKIVKLLLQAGADIHKLNEEDEKTPLYIAAENGHVEIMKLLLEAGADPNKAGELTDTPLMIAAYYGRDACVKLLLDSGADKDKVNLFDVTPLIAAVDEGHVECVRLLLDSEADINKVDADGGTALNIAVSCRHSPRKSRDQIYNLLLDATYNDIADKVLLAVSQQDIIFDTAFIIFKKVVEDTIKNVEETIKIKIKIEEFYINHPQHTRRHSFRCSTRVLNLLPCMLHIHTLINRYAHVQIKTNPSIPQTLYDLVERRTGTLRQRGGQVFSEFQHRKWNPITVMCDINDTDTHNKLYNIFQAKFSKVLK